MFVDGKMEVFMVEEFVRINLDMVVKVSLFVQFGGVRWDGVGGGGWGIGYFQVQGNMQKFNLVDMYYNIFLVILFLLR